MELDELTLRVLARRQPVANDLRFLAMVLKFVTDLERIGDKACSIARRAKETVGAKSLPPHPDLSTLSAMAHAMLREALDAFVDGDAAKAEVVLGQDEQVNALYKKMHREVVEWMTQHPDQMGTGLSVISVLRALERVDRLHA